MKKEEITIQKVKNNPAGGVLIGKDKEGQTIIPNDGSLGGFLVGKLHKEGGIKAVNLGNGQPIEMQSNEIVITAPAVSDQKKRMFEGKMMTNRQILSKINSDGGGVSFAEGGEVPKSIKHSGASYKYGGKTMTDHDIMNMMNGGGHLAKGMSLKQIAKMHNVPMSLINKQVELGLKAESEHTNKLSEQMKIVKDHLYEKPNYYTLLKKAGLKKGGAVGKQSLIKDAKSGNTPARDLNNYNDVIDLEADGMVGADSGIYADGGDVKPYDANMEGDSVDLSFLNDVTKVFDDGGATDLPKVHLLKVSSTSTSLSALTGKEFYNFRELKEGVEAVYKTLNQNIKSTIYVMVNGIGSSMGTYVSAGKNTVANFNPYTGKPSDLEKVFMKRHRYTFTKYNWSEWFGVQEKEKTTRGKKTPTQTPTSTRASSGKFSVGEIDVFNQIDKIFKEQSIIDVTAESIYEDNKTKDFTIQNLQTFEVFVIRKYLDSLGVPFELAGKEKTKALIKDYLEWKASTPASTNESKGIEVTSMMIKYYDNNGKELIANIDNVLDLKKQFDTLLNNSGSRFIYLFPIEGANPTGFDSRIYLTETPSDDEDFNPSGSSVADLKYKLKNIIFKDQNYDWKKFFDWTESETTKEEETPTTTEPVKSNRNFELERKYLTGRVNELSKELDMKRPSLLNEEIAFYQREINKFILKLRKVMNDQNEEKPITERIEAVYGLKWGAFDEQYPETDLVSYNGVKSELTNDEYLTVRTPEFKAFFGDWEQGSSAGFSKVINPKTKEPLAVWHGTNVLFTEWKTYATNNAHYFSTKRDFSEFFASEWENRTDRAGVDSKVLKDLNPNKGKFLFRCFIDVRNPIDFSRFGVDKRPISDYLTFLKINYNIGDYDFWTGLGNASGVTKDTKVYAWQIIRLWQNFTTYVKLYTTYDGYIFYEYNPNTPSGGIDNASLCFCAFESNQVKFTNAYEFNALSNDSRFDFGGTI